jgi:endo-beta-N-acetylglucosaminidase D
MKKHLLFSVLLFAATEAWSQSVPTHEMYVQYATPSSLVEALKNWEPGKNFGEGENYQDENFFISRVPLKERFLPGDWANDYLNDSNDKYFCWCAPTGEMTKKWGPLPRYNFDGDNFNMWQYVNTHSNWSNGWWRVPGAFNDVAHRNGVRTGCTYFIDWATPVNSFNEPGKTLFELALFVSLIVFISPLLALKYVVISGVALPSNNTELLILQISSATSRA